MPSEVDDNSHPLHGVEVPVANFFQTCTDDSSFRPTLRLPRSETARTAHTCTWLAITKGNDSPPLLPEGEKVEVSVSTSRTVPASYHEEKCDYNDDAETHEPVGRLRLPGETCYEGDVRVGDGFELTGGKTVVPHGYGSAFMSSEGRVVYQGEFENGRTVRCDRDQPGAVAGSYLPDLSKLYGTQRGIFVRAWFATEKGGDPFFEVQRDTWPGEHSVCLLRAALVAPPDINWSQGEHWPGPDNDRTWSIPPSVIRYLSQKGLVRLPFVGATCCRPESVRKAVAAGPEQDGLVFCTGW